MRHLYKHLLAIFIFTIGLSSHVISGVNNEFVLQSPMGFTENKGQILGYDGASHNEVKFVFQQGNTQIFLLERGIAYQFTKMHYPDGYKELLNNKEGRPDHEQLHQMQEKVRTETFRMDMVLVGADLDATITTEGKSADYTNYYNSNVLDVHHYNKITYHNIYPGIDWVIYTKNGEVKYDFVVRPGADPALIKMEFKHQEELNLNEDGSFTLKNLLGTITEKKPVSFQGDKEIATNFKLDNKTISFIPNAYDKSQTLIIDPLMQWATYYGAAAYDYGTSCFTDMAGNVYLTGTTGSPATISFGGYQNIYGGGVVDGFVVKFNSSGLRIWATYYGGSGEDQFRSGTIDASGNIYVTGLTGSTSNIASGGFQNTFGGATYDAMLVKFNSNGLRLWSTYYGGPGEDDAYRCTLDQSGNVYVAGWTMSASNIASGGHQNTYGQNGDAYLAKFNSNGQRLWATYYGDLGYNDIGNCCATDQSGNVYLGGCSNSTLNIASGGHQNTFGGGTSDAFLVKFDSNGARLWSTFYGDAGSDRGSCCIADASGNVYLVGLTSSTLNIASGGHQNTYGGHMYDAFLVKFSGSGARLWATYYGDSQLDHGLGCALDASGNVYMSGTTESTVNIALGAYQNTFGGGLGDAFLVKFDPNGLRLMGTYYGGTGEDSGNFCSVDAFGNVFMAGDTESGPSFHAGGHQTDFGGLMDAFLVKFCDLPVKPSAIAGNTLVCLSSTQSYFVNGIPGAISYQWKSPTGAAVSSPTNVISYAPTASGIYSMSATSECGTGPAQTINITVDPCTNLSQLSTNNFQLTVFPNPTKGEFRIRSTNNESSEIDIYNLLGEKIISRSFTKEEEQVDLSAFPNGLYLLVISRESKVISTTKVIKE